MTFPGLQSTDKCACAKSRACLLSSTSRNGLDVRVTRRSSPPCPPAHVASPPFFFVRLPAPPIEQEARAPSTKRYRNCLLNVSAPPLAHLFAHNVRAKINRSCMSLFLTPSPPAAPPTSPHTQKPKLGRKVAKHSPSLPLRAQPKP